MGNKREFITGFTIEKEALQAYNKVVDLYRGSDDWEYPVNLTPDEVLDCSALDDVNACLAALWDDPHDDDDDEVCAGLIYSELEETLMSLRDYCVMERNAAHNREVLQAIEDKTYILE